jgi:release factor glutamine methyltransferase
MMTDRPTHDRGQDDLAAARAYGEALDRATTLLRQRPESPAAATPALDAQVLLAHITGAARTTILTYPERPLSSEEARRFAALVARRLSGEPVAYLVGRREFFGLDLLADRRALIPRPETELLVEAALVGLRARRARRPGEEPLIAADVGTGSGAIALALVAHEPRLGLVYAIDLSAEALALARENAERLYLAERVRFLRGDLLEPLPEPVDLLLANLPYVAPRDAAMLPDDVRRYEPELALYAADDGLALLRRFFASAPTRLKPGALVGVEFGYNQRSAVEALAREAFPVATLRVGADYAGWDRFALIAT